MKYLGGDDVILSLLLNLVFDIIMLLLGWLTIPLMPTELYDSISTFLTMLTENMGFIGFFIRWRTVEIAFPFVIVLLTSTHMYDMVMWILNKIPAASIDVAAWYSAQGYNALNTAIQEINVYGYQKLIIRENGNIIHTKGDGTEVLSGTMPAFIPKTGWDEFVSLLVRDELKANIADDSIVIAW